MKLLRPGMHVHLVGIGGIGLSAIARVLHGWGYVVSGSDIQPSALLDALSAEGIAAYPSHKAAQVAGAEIVVASSAISEDNPELREARRRGIPVVKREQFLSELTAGKCTVAVAGTHGKTTTSAMISWILTEADLDPTFIVGGLLQNLGTNARAGNGPHFVIEADEYDRAFLGLNPEIAVIASMEHDHPDCYPTLDAMKAAFQEFAGRLVEGGLLIVCGEDPEGNELGIRMQAEGRRVQTYGLDAEWDWRAQGVELGNSAAFEVWHKGKHLGTCALQIPGRHNVLNALAALAACYELGVEFGLAAAALTRFRGTARRFEVKGQAAEVTVVDDYAHHPTEIEATLAAARLKYPDRPIWAVFQPHTYSRTATLLDDFAGAFGGADHVIVTEIYAAREQNTLGVSGRDLVQLMDHPDAGYAATLKDAASAVLERVRPGDVVITLGAGDGYLIGEWVLQTLRERAVPTMLRAGQPGNGNNARIGGRSGQMARLADALAAVLGPDAVRRDQPLARHTSLRVGGPADLLVVAETAEALRQTVTLACQHHVPVRVFGAGSNMLVSDAGVRGLVVLNRARATTFPPAGNNAAAGDLIVRVESGASLSTVARQCVTRGLAGLEWAATIPGTVGGAVVGNAGAWDGNVASTLVSASVLERGETVVEWPVERFEYTYRSSILKRQAKPGLLPTVVLEAHFALQRGDRGALETQVADMVARRKASQPSGATCGSVFKNPPGDYAGRLIEAAGLKGVSRGNAEISPVHANFIVNHGEAAAADIYALISLARETVKSKFGVDLELEIQLVGDWEAGAQRLHPSMRVNSR